MKRSQRRPKRRPSGPHPKVEQQPSGAVPTSIALVAAASAAAGVLMNAYLAYVHHHIRHAPGWRSPKWMGVPLSCDGFLVGSFGTPFFVPLPIFAVLLFLMLVIEGVRAACARSPEAASPHILRLLLGGAATLALAAIAGVIAGFATSELCLTGLATIAAAAGVVVLARLALMRTNPRQAVVVALDSMWAALLPHNPLRLGAFASVAITGTALFEVYGPGRTPPLCDALAHAAVSGTQESPSEITIFDDFQCAHCRRAHTAVRKMRSAPQVRFVERHYPWDAECNEGVRLEGHAGECRQARAAICAERMGGGQRFRDRLFESNAISEADLADLGASSGLDRGELQSCMASSETLRILKEDIRAATAHGVVGTPTFIVGAQRYTGFGEEEARCFQ